MIHARSTRFVLSILFLSIPFDPGWHIYIDEREVKKIKVNIGFLGAFISAGRHRIKLVYKPPYFTMGKLVSIGTLVAFVFSLMFFREQSKHLLSLP